MAIKFNRSQTFATNGTVTAAGLHNLVDGLDIYQALITDQTNLTSVGTADELLIADADLTSGDAPKAVTVQELFNDALSVGTYTDAYLTGSFTTGTANITTGTIPNLTIGTTTATKGTVTTLNSTTGTITNLTSGTTTSTAANVTTGTVQTLTASTATITGGTYSGAINSTAGTISTLNSTTGTIGNLTTTLVGDLTISGGTSTLGTTGVTAGTYGTGGIIPRISVDSKGRITTASTSEYALDNSIAFVKFLSTDWTSSHASAGYQKLPSGLIIQWGSSSANTSGVSVTFPITFPNAAYCVVATNNNQSNPPAPSCSSLSTTGFTATVSAGSPNFFYIAMGK